ncbi:MAG: BlaI/MecI/CopY family transcriptional regulator [Dehalococcoidia bacterium]
MRQFGELEAAIMDRLWSWGESATVRDVLEDLQRERPIAYTTIMTVMDNLHRKEFLARELDGRAYRYWPVSTREQHAAELMREVLDASTDRTATLVQFLRQMRPTDVARLRKALEAASSKGKRR